METTAQRITFLRMSKNLKKSELSRMIGVKQATLAKWENGKSLPNGESLIKIWEALMVSPDMVLLGFCACSGSKKIQ